MNHLASIITSLPHFEAVYLCSCTNKSKKKRFSILFVYLYNIIKINNEMNFKIAFIILVFIIVSIDIVSLNKKVQS